MREQENSKNKKASQRPRPPIRGIAIHFCSCAAPCGCMFATKDMEGCNLIGVYHIAEGGYLEKVYPGKSVRGLTFVVAHRPQVLIDSKKGLVENGRPVAEVLYLPQGIAKNQENSIRLAYAEYLIGMGSSGILLSRFAPIRFTPRVGGYEVQIPGILYARTEPILGKAERQLAVDNVAFREGTRWLLGRAIKHTYTDPQEKEWNWDLPNSNGAWCRFTWEELNHGE